MISIQGKGVSTGVAIGPLYYYQRAKSTIRRYEVEDAEAEWQRFKTAQATCIEQLGALAERFPGAVAAREIASASTWAAPSDFRYCAASDFPHPMPPVSPIT